ncbi:MAG: lactonase family protein [Janthinobacterium lividum]
MPTRRRVLATLPAAALLLRQSFAAQSAPPTLRLQRAYLGTTGKAGQGIFTAEFDNSTGTFARPEMAVPLPGNDCMALTRNRKHLLSICAVDGAAQVVAFEVQDGPEPLHEVSRQPTGGNIGNFISLDRTERICMEANWGSGDVSTFPFGKDGTLSAAVEHIQYGDANHGPTPMQPHSRCHSILEAPGDGRFVLVNDYGADRIYIYRLDPATARLTAHDPPFYAAPPGSAPRHLVFHPNGRVIYCNNELSNTIDLLQWDGKHGTLARVASYSTLPPDAPPKNRTADMVLSPDARFLYGSVRDSNTISTWAVQRDGTLHPVGAPVKNGAENRCIALDATGRWLLAANVNGSENVTIFPRDPKTGLLSPQSSSTPLPGACMIVWG